MRGRKKGSPKIAGSGRAKGTQNKLTVSMKEMVSATLVGLGGAENMLRWAQENETEFYKIAARLIPSELAGSVGVEGTCRLIIHGA